MLQRSDRSTIYRLLVVLYKLKLISLDEQHDLNTEWKKRYSTQPMQNSPFRQKIEEWDQ